MLCLPVPPAARVPGTVCFHYGHTGHFAWDCTTLKKTTTQGHVNYPPRGQ
jgi:hypothetical protein